MITRSEAIAQLKDGEGGAEAPDSSQLESAPEPDGDDAAKAGTEEAVAKEAPAPEAAAEEAASEDGASEAPAELSDADRKTVPDEQAEESAESEG